MVRAFGARRTDQRRSEPGGTTDVVDGPAPLKLDVQLSDSVIDAVERARALEQMGVDGAFSFENSHDLFLPLAAAAPVCSLDLYTNVAIAFPRSPMHLADTAYDLHQLSGGRFSLGLGSQVRPHIEKRFGSRWGRPVAQMREWVLATKAILHHWQDGTPLAFEGEYTRHTLMTVAFNPGPNPCGVPKILVGALGPRMNQMAAEVADGILVMPFNSGRHMAERTIPAIERGSRSPVAGARTSRSPSRSSSAWGAPNRSWRGPRPSPASSPSTARRRPTGPCSTSTAGASCSPSSTACRRRATGRR